MSPRYRRTQPTEHFATLEAGQIASARGTDRGNLRKDVTSYYKRGGSTLIGRRLTHLHGRLRQTPIPWQPWPPTLVPERANFPALPQKTDSGTTLGPHVLSRLSRRSAA